MTEKLLIAGGIIFFVVYVVWSIGYMNQKNKEEDENRSRKPYAYDSNNNHPSWQYRNIPGWHR